MYLYIVILLLFYIAFFKGKDLIFIHTMRTRIEKRTIGGEKLFERKLHEISSQ